MKKHYVFMASRSHFTVQAFATGMLSFLGHSPVFAVGDFSGGVDFDSDDPARTSLALTVNAGSITLVDRVSDADRQEIEGRMRGDVLETAVYSTITFQSEKVEARALGSGRFAIDIGGRLTLHGVSRPFLAETELVRVEESIHLRGGGRLLMSRFGIKPVSAVGGTIKLKDEVRLAYDIFALAEAP
jgi:polyisoprenoid-binding protein YceI